MITRDQPATTDTRPEINAPAEYLEFAVIQRGCTVHGAGETADAALEDALRYLGTDRSGQPYTMEALLLAVRYSPRTISVLELIERREDPEFFDRYLDAVGAFRFDGTGWLLAE